MMTSPEFKVGALVVIVSGLIAIMSLKVTEGPGVFSGQNTYWFEIEDAAGLVKNSTVRTAGINVGVIEDIRLVNGRARIYVSIKSEVVLKTSAVVELRASGILGDKYIELLPGSPTDSPMEDGSQILTTKERGSLDAVVKEVAKISTSLSSLAQTLDRSLKEGDDKSKLGRIILNIETLTADLADVTTANKNKINDIVDQVNSITSSLDQFVNDDTPDGFRAGWDKAVSSLGRIDTSLKNIEEITDKINTGKGTLGRLVNDEDTVNKINTAVDNVNEFLGGASAIETSVDFHTEYLASSSQSKSYLNFKIQPGLDRYYEIGVIDDPRGVTTTTDTIISGTSSSNTTETRTFKDRLKFTALFAKNFYDFTVKGGVIESTGGVAFDYHFYRRRFKLSMEAFQFSDLNLRAYLKYNITDGIYVVGGGDNLTNSSLSSGFLGAGIFITNDDLKTLASKVSF